MNWKERSEMLDKRLAICKSCPIYKASTGRCDSSKGGCGCFMKIKASFSSSTCPTNKW